MKIIATCSVCGKPMIGKAGRDKCDVCTVQSSISDMDSESVLSDEPDPHGSEASTADVPVIVVEEVQWPEK